MKKQRMELKIPWLGEDISRIQVVEWLITIGDQVEIDQDLVTLELDGETFLLPSPMDGILMEITAGPGELVEFGQIIAVFEII